MNSGSGVNEESCANRAWHVNGVSGGDDLNDLGHVSVVSSSMSKESSMDKESEKPCHAAPIVGRFAPSPTGRLHLGNIAAMLLAWLAARAADGSIVLRIEDIDYERMMADADRWIMDDLTWLGLDWDGEPIWQSQRTELYREAMKKLIEFPVKHMPALGSDRLIYPCFCSRADIRAASAPQRGDGFVIYPGTCRHYSHEDSGRLTPDGELVADPRPAARPRTAREIRKGIAGELRQHSLRIAVPTSPTCPASVVRFTDVLCGAQKWNLTTDLGDTIVKRADGHYAYQFVVVYDDLAQGVNQIVRGRDLDRSTALQIWIRQALLASNAVDVPRSSSQNGESDMRDQRNPTAQNPQYWHIPLLTDAAGKRLAKRDKDLELATLREKGVKPQAVLGYLAGILGIGDGSDISADDLVKQYRSFHAENLAKTLIQAGMQDRAVNLADLETRFGISL